MTFTPLGFNPHSEQVCFVATVKGASGQDTFTYSGGILAFIPATKRVATSFPDGKVADGKKKMKFDL